MSVPYPPSRPEVLDDADEPKQLSDGRFSAGSVQRRTGEIEHVYSDQRCTVCGHVPCPCCGTWCDELLSDEEAEKTGSMCCCDGECKYAAEPKFTLIDGKAWEP